jgi:toxin-antitoxin system PIN domain toxin
MNLVDANILLYAEDSTSESHDRARIWWDEQLSGTDPICLCWPVLNAFIRIGTNTRLHLRPFTMKEAIEHVMIWLDQPCVRIVQPTDGHWRIFQKVLTNGKAIGNLVSDAHLAALAIEHNCVLQSTDADFSRFKGLKWQNPLLDGKDPT